MAKRVGCWHPWKVVFKSFAIVVQILGHVALGCRFDTSSDSSAVSTRAAGVAKEKVANERIEK